MAINISFKLLKAFLTLSEQKNFTRAAEHCHVSQSTFSGMIQRLEDELGARLFDRNTRNVVMTPEGELFAEAARQLVDDIQWTFSGLERLRRQEEGPRRHRRAPIYCWRVAASCRRRVPALVSGHRHRNSRCAVR